MSQIYRSVCYMYSKGEDWKLQGEHSGTLTVNKLKKLEINPYDGKQQLKGEGGGL